MRLRRSILATLLAADLMGVAGCAEGSGLPSIALNVGSPSRSAPRPTPAANAAPAPSFDAAKSRSLYLALIRDMRKTGKPWAALAHLDEFDRRYGRDDEASLLRGDCLIDIGDYAKAEVVYRKLLQGRAAGRAYRGLGRIAAKQDNWAAAAGSFGEAVRRDPTSADAVNDLGYALMKAGDAKAAAFRLRQAHDLAPADQTVLSNLVLALSASGADAESETLMQTLAPADRGKVAALLDAQNTGLSPP